MGSFLVNSDFDTVAEALAKSAEVRDILDRGSIGKDPAVTRDVVESWLASQRTPSRNIGPGKADYGDYGASDGSNFFASLAKARSRDAREQAQGKAELADMGSRWSEAQGKATLGDSDANGGYLVPRELAKIVELSTMANPIRQLLDVIPGIASSPVNIPTEGEAPARAVVHVLGQLKENVNFTIGNYTATMYTLARIFDVANSLLKHSAGAAERLVRSKLARAFALGETYYVLGERHGRAEGPAHRARRVAGGPHDGPHGGRQHRGRIRPGGRRQGHRGPGRPGREPTGVLLNTGDLAHAMLQGSDNGGFWVDAGSGVAGLIGLPGVAIHTSTGMTSKTAIAGEWKSAQLYLGEGYRVDVSDVAGTRWDKNETGFRGEEEMGFNADPYVAAGMFQRITGLIP